MKQAILLTLAMLFAFAMPVQATEILGFAPVESLIGSGSGEAPAMVLTDDKVTTSRTMRQLEAAELITDSKVTYAMIGGGSSNAYMPTTQGAVHEVGWRNTETI